MSKKAEFMKNAVFYGQQKPEVLGNILAGLVEDTLTRVVFTEFSTEVTIPADSSTTANFLAEGRSQYDDKMADEVTYSLESVHEGATIDGSSGVLTVQSTTSPAEIVVKATCGGKEAKVTVNLKSAEE